MEAFDIMKDKENKKIYQTILGKEETSNIVKRKSREFE
jgi:hypothetical protein